MLEMPPKIHEVLNMTWFDRVLNLIGLKRSANSESTDELSEARLKKLDILGGNWISHRYDSSGKLIAWTTSLQDSDGHIVLHTHGANDELLELVHVRKSQSPEVNRMARELNAQYNTDYITEWNFRVERLK
jgi:hypothetical protein